MGQEIIQGGLFRCCLETINESEEDEDGKIILCKHCNNKMLLKNNVWKRHKD